MVQARLLTRPVAAPDRPTPLSLVYTDVFWQVHPRVPALLALRLALRRTRNGLTQEVLALGPEATQAIGIPAGAGERVYGTTDLLRLPAGAATLVGNISLAQWRGDAVYTVTASVWRETDGRWEQEGDAVEWTLPPFDTLRAGSAQRLGATAVAALRVLML